MIFFSSLRLPRFPGQMNLCPWAKGTVFILLVAAFASNALGGQGPGGGVVATAHPLATEAAMEMLANGGNAVDAAVAAAFAIGVVEPDGSGLGGGGGMLVYLHETGKTVYINYYHSSTADPDAISFASATDRSTAKSALVPGTTAGLCKALQDYGNLPLKTVIAPAIRHAKEGFAVDVTLAGLLLDNMEVLAADPALSEIFLNMGFPKMEGELLFQPELAHVLELISLHGSDGFYKGETAERLSEGINALGGMMTLEDLADFEPTVSDPVRGTYRDLEIVSAQAPHSGVILVEIMNMIERVEFESGNHFSDSARDIHILAEVFRRAYADRSQYLGDPRFRDVPTIGLGSKQFANERFADINHFRAQPRDYRDTAFGFPAKFDQAEQSRVPYGAQKPGNSVTWDDDNEDNPGLNDSFDDPFDRWKKQAGTKKTGDDADSPKFWTDDENDEFDGGHTTHLSVMDADSNMVSLTQTLGNFFGSKTVINGILLNNGRINFSSTSVANLIEPNKRPRSSITPTLVFKKGRPFMSLGSPGAGRIIATVAQILVNVVDFGMDLEAANAAPRFFCQKFDDYLYVENRIDSKVISDLENMGHNVRALGDLDLFFGGVQMTAFNLDGSGFSGSADPRRGGNAAVLYPEDP